MKRFLTATTIALLGVVLLALNGGVLAEGKAPTRSDDGAGLSEFDSCKDLNNYAERHPRSLRWLSGGRMVLEDGIPDSGGGEKAPAAPTSATGTNVQEAGVDEPDIVKVSGSTLFAIAKGQLHSVDAAGASPQLLDSIELPGSADSYYYGYGAELLIAGDRALVISNGGYGYGGAERLSFAPYSPQSVIAELDISDPSALRITKTMRLEGSYVSSRLTGSTARLVVSATPEYPAAPDSPDYDIGVVGPKPVQSKRNRAEDEIEQRGPRWLPTAIVKNRSTGRKVARPLAPCTEVSRPETFSGLDTLTVLTIDLARGLPAVDSDAITTSGEILYGSTESLYVATQHWFDGGRTPGSISDVSTEIHKFSTSDPLETEYRASGEVPGFMLSQWSMSEHEDVLRVASTTSPPWTDDGPSDKSQSFVTTLGESDDGELEQIGQLGGLGSDEQIYAVRFIGETGFVVTFRQVDPLYTLDLSDPAAPKVLGELKIPGYSAYLHPAADGLMLGVGQAATKQGQLEGAQVSIFDISNLASPSLIEQHGIAPYAYSEVEYDHHAFLFHSPTDLMVIPVDYYDQDSGETLFNGAIGFRADANGIEEVGRVTHGSRNRASVRRSLVLDDRLFTISDRGVVVSNLTTLAAEGEARFPDEP